VSGLLDGRTVLITGAGAGIGRGIALLAADEGAHVVVTSLGPNGGAVAVEVRERGGRATWVVCDVTDRAAIRGAVAAAVEETGRLDGLVHNALSRPLGPDTPTSIEALGADAWEHQVSVALRGAYYCAVEAHPHLAATEGRLVLMTSGAGIEGSPLMGSYATCKAAIRGFTKSLAREWGGSRITVNAVSPLVRTPAFDRSVEDPAQAAFILSLSALGYVGETLTDVAPPIVFLLSDAARYVTGQTLVVDGGRCIQL
jgi:NAD(P)-dependent dehydrogenase (short-subunit alcohol dehydrogenase family)